MGYISIFFGKLRAIYIYFVNYEIYFVNYGIYFNILGRFRAIF